MPETNRYRNTTYGLKFSVFRRSLRRKIYKRFIGSTALEREMEQDVRELTQTPMSYQLNESVDAIWDSLETKLKE